MGLRVYMLSRIYAKIKSSRIKSVLQYLTEQMVTPVCTDNYLRVHVEGMEIIIIGEFFPWRNVPQSKQSHPVRAIHVPVIRQYHMKRNVPQSKQSHPVCPIHVPVL